MKAKYIILIFISLFFSKELLTQPCSLNVQPIKMKPPAYGLGYADFELAIYNQTLWFGTESSDTIMVIMTPAGAYFDGTFKYNPNSAYTIGDPQIYTTISGTIIKIPPQSSINNFSRVEGNWDKTQGSSEAKFAFGIGKYKFEFYRRVEDSSTGLYHWEYSDYVYLDFSDVRLGLLPSIYGSVYDIRLDYFSKDTITYQYNARALNYPDYDSTFWLIDLVNKDIKMWELFGTCLDPIARERGNLKSDTSNNKSYLNWPIEANNFNGNIGQEDPGYLKMNLEIQNNHYARINRGIPFSVNDSAILSLKHSDTYANNARLYVENNSVFTVKETAELEINKYGNVIIEDGGKMYMEDNSNIYFADHGEIIINAGGTLYNCGANFTNNNYSCILVNDSGKYFEGAPECYFTTHYVNDGAFVVINGGDLIIGDNSKIIFDGASSFLRINPQSKIFLGENASIEFKNGAYLSANGGTFNSIDSLKKWKGIVLENSGVDSIVNCTFSNAKTAITIKNTYGSYVNRVIKNNTFNIPTGGDHKGIYGENNYNILIQHNTFNMPVVNQGGSPYYSGIFLKNSGSGESSGQTEEESMPFPYSLNIVNNTFKNGSVSMILANYLSNVLPYYVKGNTFDSAYSVGLLGLKITGTVRDNVSSDFMTPLGIHLVNSSPNLYNNTVIARDVSLHLIGNCYPNLSPYIYGNQLTWTGGKNRFTSQNYDNIQLVHPANVYTDFGENRFTIFDTASAYHIYGWLDSTITKYAGRNNCWYPANTAKIYLRHSLTGNPVSTVTGVTTLDCDHEIDPNGWSVDYLGNGIYDSVKQSVNNTGNVPAEEDLIYEQAYSYMNQYLYLDAIGSFKDLIDTYYDYEDLPKSALDLYTCYEYLDTSLTQSERNTLFGNLKVYAEAKISSGNYSNEEFLDNCLDIITMCETKLENYDAAANNYEFIALYHPDPDIRLIASWNYAEIEALLNSGNGGGEQFQITNDNPPQAEQIDQVQDISDELQNHEIMEKKELERMNKIISNDPILSRMKKTYEKITSSRKDETAKRIQQRYEGRSIGKTEKINDYIRKSGELDNSKEIKAKRNLFELIELRNINPEELEKRRIEDMLLSMRIIDIESESDEVANLPFEYKLSQNYPNPFNPVTTINFSIPKQGNVTLKVYDVTGKEVRTLINEQRSAGNYTVSFSATGGGSSLSSGVYFYRLESGDFKETRRMILLK